MTKTHIPYPSTNQFHSVVKQVRDTCKYHSAPLPKLTFHGTVKLHGTNAGISFNAGNPSDFWVQSRSNIISPESDNNGFAAYIHKNRDVISKLMQLVNGYSAPGQVMSVYGEWCGGNIQKNVAVTQLERMFVIFGISIVSGDTTTWFNPIMIANALYPIINELNSIRTFNINKFEIYQIDIDFANPELSQNVLVDYTNKVEAECPVGKYFGVSGVGEGIVWRNHDFWYKQELFFKVKGEKHSESKVKSLAEVDVEKIQNVKLLAEAIVTDHRLEKKFDELKGERDSISNDDMGSFLKLVNTDVLKEELDRIVASDLEVKSVMKAVSGIARNWFMKTVNKV